MSSIDVQDLLGHPAPSMPSLAAFVLGFPLMVVAVGRRGGGGGVLSGLDACVKPTIGGCGCVTAKVSAFVAGFPSSIATIG